MKIDDFTPGQWRVTWALLGAAKDGGDYIRQLGNYASREAALEGIAQDRDYWSKPANRTMGGLFEDDGAKGQRVYRLHFCPVWEPQEI